MREILSFDKNWFFELGDFDKAETIQFDHSSWKNIDLPHDWSIGGNYDSAIPFQIGFLHTGIGWYRKVFNVNSCWLKKSIYLSFDGIFMNSQIWINNKFIGERSYGYIEFGFDITSFLVEGPNVIAIKIDCQEQPASRWYNGSGIYRHTWLTITDKTHINPWGVFIRTVDVKENTAELTCEISLDNHESTAGEDIKI